MLDEGALTGAGVPDETHELTVGYLNIDIVYCDLFKGRVRAVNMAQTADLNF